MKKLLLVLLFTISSLQFANATGLHTCDAGDKSKWQTKETLQKKLTEAGWKIRKIKEDGGCYEVYATNPDGQRGEAYFHPETLELEIMARRGKILFKKGE